MLDKSGQPLSWEDVLPDETGFQRFIPISFGTSFHDAWSVFSIEK